MDDACHCHGVPHHVLSLKNAHADSFFDDTIFALSPMSHGASPDGKNMRFDAIIFADSLIAHDEISIIIPKHELSRLYCARPQKYRHLIKLLTHTQL